MIERNIINYPEDVDNLFLNLYLVGYVNEGESILITVSSKMPEEKIFYMGIVDSFIKENINVTTELIKKILNNKNKKLDLLCWTHPHDDHTKGMVDIIEKYCNKDTLYAMPNVFNIGENVLSSDSNDVIDTIIKMNFNKHVKNRMNLETLSGQGDLQMLNIGNSRSPNQMTIKYYGPYPNIFCMQRPDNVDLNKYSTSLMLCFNGFNIYLGGDTENMNIQSFRNFPKRIHCIKIPHHTSKTSLYLTKLLNPIDIPEIACTTIYNEKLPQEEALIEYINLSKKMFCTSKNIFKSKKLSHNNKEYKYDKNMNVNSLKNTDYGILKIEIDVINGEYTSYLGGDATSVIKRI